MDEPTAKRIGKLLRLLGSNQDGEVLAAVAALKRICESENLSFHDISAMVEKDGELRFSEDEAKSIYQEGYDRGEEQGRKQSEHEVTEFHDADGRPRWHAIAMYCQEKRDHLDSRHHEFIDDMAGLTVWRVPTPKQGKYLLSLFFKLGSGRR
jgi:hypothetical protein